ncbi:unnamed protein product, partial [Linum tenue]
SNPLPPLLPTCRPILLLSFTRKKKEELLLSPIFTSSSLTLGNIPLLLASSVLWIKPPGNHTTNFYGSKLRPKQI